MFPVLPIPLPDTIGCIVAVCIAIVLFRQTKGLSRVWRYLITIIAALCAGFIVVVSGVSQWEDVAQLPLFAFCFCGGLLFAWALIVYRAKEINISEPSLLRIALIALPCGLLGARLRYVQEYWHEFAELEGQTFWLSLIDMNSGGMVLLGGVVCAALAVFVLAKKEKIPLAILADLIAPCLLLAVAFGRLGCFANGCCYGAPTEQAWGITQPLTNSIVQCDAHGALSCTEQQSYMSWREQQKYGHALTEAPSRHPVQLYAFFSLCLLALAHWLWWPRRPRPGILACSACASYGFVRFLLECVRGDNNAVASSCYGLFPCTGSQMISLHLFIFGLVGVFLLYRMKKLKSVDEEVDE